MNIISTPSTMYQVGREEPLPAFVHICDWPAHPDEKFIFFLWVEPEHRGRGLATQLMKRVCEDFRDCRIHLRPNPFLRSVSSHSLDEHDLRIFYKKFGFYEHEGKYKEYMTREPDPVFGGGDKS